MHSRWCMASPCMPRHNKGMWDVDVAAAAALSSQPNRLAYPCFNFYCTPLLFSLPPPPPRQPSVLGHSLVHIHTCGGMRPILPWLKEKQEKRAPPCRLSPPLRPRSLSSNNASLTFKPPFLHSLAQTGVKPARRSRSCRRTSPLSPNLIVSIRSVYPIISLL
jgi:hypothetical protein